MKLSEFKRWASASGVKISRSNVLEMYLVYLNEVITQK
jgi:hypothetical protein